MEGEQRTSNKNMAGGHITPSETCRVGVRIPPFWPEEPEVWFAQVESQFLISGISSDATKFNFITSQLDQEHARIVKDVIINPPASDRYEKLKYELIKRISQSREKRTLQLLQHEELGDRKPSQFLRHLKSLAGPEIPNDFLLTIWSSRLPPHVQTIVASQRKADIDDIADLADRVNDIVQPQVASTAVSQPSALELKVEELTKRLDSFARSRRYSPHRRSHYRQRSHSRHRSCSRERPDDHPHCWYNFSFGAKAKKCKSPCTFNSGNAKSSH